METLIYCQRKIPRKKLRYGLRSSAATGCGWIATYNALRLMGFWAAPQALIRWYQWQLPLIHGNLGTTILAPAFFFMRHGFRVDYTADESRFDSLAKEADACVLFYRWHRGVKLGAHFVAVRYRDGRFEGFNTYRNSTGPDDYGASLASFFKTAALFCTGADWYQAMKKPSQHGVGAVFGY